MFYNLHFHLLYCNLTKNCKVYHKAYLLLNSDRAISTEFSLWIKEPESFSCPSRGVDMAFCSYQLKMNLKDNNYCYCLFDPTIGQQPGTLSNG